MPYIWCEGWTLRLLTCTNVTYLYIRWQDAWQHLKNQWCMPAIKRQWIQDSSSTLFDMMKGVRSRTSVFLNGIISNAPRNAWSLPIPAEWRRVQYCEKKNDTPQSGHLTSGIYNYTIVYVILWSKSNFNVSLEGLPRRASTHQDHPAVLERMIRSAIPY